MGVAAETLALMEAYLGSLFDWVPGPLLLVDLEGVIIRANASAEQLLDSGLLIGRDVQTSCRSSNPDKGQAVCGLVRSGAEHSTSALVAWARHRCSSSTGWQRCRAVVSSTRHRRSGLGGRASPPRAWLTSERTQQVPSR
jgi:PAS domain-containing protein